MVMRLRRRCAAPSLLINMMGEPVTVEIATAVKYHTCPFCEATCGLAIELEDGVVTKVRGDADDVFSQGFICPKSTALPALHNDPDRVRTPLIKRDGEFVEVSWQEAFAEIDRRLTPILESHGRNAAAVYLGNPSAHGLEAMVYNRALIKALGTQNVFTASTVDQMPKHVSCGLMFGTMMSIPIPDVDRTDHLLIIGANPLVSNGSLMTAPNLRGRLRAIQERGGRVVVVDPRRTRTAEAADQHVFIRPGGDALLLMAMVNVLFAERRSDCGDLAELIDGVEHLSELSEPFTPEAVAGRCGVEAETIRSLARELAAAEKACVYGRIGTCTQQFGTLANWLIDVLNMLTGNLDRPGGAMFPRPAAGGLNTSGKPGSGRGARLGRWSSRVRQAPEVFGELPVSCLAEEIDTPGEGQIRALFTVAGNPVVSTPNAGRLAGALEGLELFVSLDMYVNETSRHADVILPPPSPLMRSHYDLAFYQLSVRNIANYSSPVLEPDPEQQHEWQTLLSLAAIAAGQGPEADLEAWDSIVIGTLIGTELAREDSPLGGRSFDQLLAELEPRRGPERVLDFLLRSGPYGDQFGQVPDGLTLSVLEDAEHGVDLGPLMPRMPEVLRTPNGRIDIAPAPIVADAPRLLAELGESGDGDGELLLIGRRQLRSNNSWMHNVEHLVRGGNDCTLQVNPEDAARFGLVGGERAKVSSRAGDVLASVEVTDALMPGVVSIPHGWGHDEPGARLSVAAGKPGVNSNRLADETQVDAVSGNAVLNGIPVTVAPAGAAAEPQTAEA
jgi:anaerobic selenocysteine-containing dehydrogenase